MKKWIMFLFAGMLFSVSANAAPRIIINKDTYTLQLIDDNMVQQTQRVIVGRKSRPTPSMYVVMTHIVFHPSWNVPGKLARLDIVPKIKNDPTTIDRLGYRFFEDHQQTVELSPEEIDWNALNKHTPIPFRIRQDPGPVNSLGRIKFILDNPRAIFLHGTPNTILFDQEVREFSSGCIRIEDPESLAQYLLPNVDVSSMLAGPNQERWVRLNQPIWVEVTDGETWMF